MNRISYMIFMCLSAVMATAAATDAQARDLRPLTRRDLGGLRMVMPPEFMPGGGIPAGVPPIEALVTWCERAIPILRRGQAEALRFTYMGQPEEALATLEEAMTHALNSEGSLGRSRTMTGRMLQRGLYLTASLHQEFGQMNERELQAFLNFVGKWVEFVIGVAADLDQDWYLPYLQTVSRCHYTCVPDGYDPTEFQNRYVQMASRELGVVTQSLANGYTPLGSGRFFLRAAQRVIYSVANDDLAGNINAPAYACLISSLNELSCRIQDGLNEAGNYPYLVQDTIDTVNWAISAADGGCNCSR